MISQWSTFSYFGLIFKLVRAALRQEWGGPVRRVLPQPRYKTEAPSWLRQSRGRGWHSGTSRRAGGRPESSDYGWGSGLNCLETGAASGRHPISEWLRGAPYLMRQEVLRQAAPRMGDGSGVRVLSAWPLVAY